MRRATRLAAAVIAAAVAARAAAAQEQPRTHFGIDRVGTYLSYAWADHARRAREFGADVDLGSLVFPALRVAAELNYFTADVDRRNAIGTPVDGSFHDFSMSGEVSAAPVRIGRAEPYVGAGIGVHFRGDRDINDPLVRDLYRGAVLGGHYFGGVSVDLTRDRRWAAYVEVRRVEAQNVGRTLGRLGAFVRLRGGSS
jgi:hypothetical protein